MRRVVTVLVAAFILLPVTAAAGSWSDKVKISGDFRFRHELIQDESKEEDRTRWRIRARLILSAELDENFSVGLRLASGSDDPVSTNQDLSGGWSTKEFNLDLAYFDFHPDAVKGLNLIGGKMKLPFQKVQKSELIWDGDLNPEGIAAKFKGDLGERVAVMIGTGFFYIDENKEADDFWMAGGQGLVKIQPVDEIHILAGAGYYDYNIDAGVTPVFFDDKDSFGNSSVAGEGEQLLYASDYNQFEILGEFGMKKNGNAFYLYGNFVKNTAADSLNQAYLAGAAIKRGKGKGNLKLAVTYRSIENDAVIGAFTDSDFRGGGTDGNGFELGLGYGVADKANVGLSLFLNNKGIDEQVDYKRLMVDLSLKF